jgi:hypothetical protein
MEASLVWGYIHILLFVFWLGADVGVFLSAIYAKRTDLSFETRFTILQLGLVIDFLPRICFALIFPVGLHLTDSLGLYIVPSWLFIFGWILGVGWVALVVLIGRNEGTPLAQRLSLFQFGLQAVLGTCYASVALWSLFGSGPLTETWFAVKVLLFGFIFYAAMGIDICFKPVMAPFMEIGKQGSTPERELAVTRSVNNTLVAVLTLYLLIALTAFVGKVKPF